MNLFDSQNEFRDNVFLGGSGHGIQLTGEGLLQNEIHDNWFYVRITWRQRIIVWLHWLLLAALLYSLSACASHPYPITAGSHVSNVPLGRFVIWSNHPGVESYLTSLVLMTGQPVMERSKLQRVFDEQKMRLSHTTDDILKVGHLVGATQVLFADVEIVHLQTAVTLRAVDVESGRVLWAGSARYLEAMASPDQAVVALTYWALVRALCDGTWEEPSARKTGGCQTAQAEAVSVNTAESKQEPEPTIWREMKGMER